MTNAGALLPAPALLSFISSKHGLGDVCLFRIGDTVDLRMFPFIPFPETSDIPLPDGLADGIYEDGITHELADGLTDLPF